MILHACCKLSQHDHLFSLLLQVRNRCHSLFTIQLCPPVTCRLASQMKTLRVMPDKVTMNTLAAGFTGDRQKLEQMLQSFQGTLVGANMGGALDGKKDIHCPSPVGGW